MLCPICKTNPASYNPYYGYLPCVQCTIKQKTLKRPKESVELLPQRIKDDRKAYGKDFLPFHRKGQLDKGAVERYGVKKVKQQGFTDKEIKEAKHVWAGDDGVSYYRKGN